MGRDRSLFVFLDSSVSLWLLIGMLMASNGSLCVLISPCAPLSVLLDPYRFLCVLMGPNESLWIFMCHYRL